MDIKYRDTIEALYDAYFDINTQQEEGDNIAGAEQENAQDEIQDNIYEVTSYFFLERLFQTLPFSKEDHLVDFGCGKGRVLFMAAHYSCPHVTGYENNKARFEILTNNIRQYQGKHGEGTIFDVHNVDAQGAVIDDRANRFFFFEPFHLDIFDQVVKNIQDSLKRRQREVMLFLYLPHNSTLEYFDHIEGFKREIYVDSTLYHTDAALVTMPQFAFYANYSMVDSVDPGFLLY